MRCAPGVRLSVRLTSVFGNQRDDSFAKLEWLTEVGCIYLKFPL